MKMNTQLNILERRIRIAALMVVIGLAGTLASLLIFHPLSFVGFILVGIMLILIANFYFLLALIRGTGRHRTEQAMAA